MPLTAKGKKIRAAMHEQYGAKKGESVFYASINKGNIKGAEKGGKVRSSVVSGGVVPAFEYGGKVRAGEVDVGSGHGENRQAHARGISHALTETEAAKSVHPMAHAKKVGGGRW
jgi:hypothetical protein